MKNQHMVPCGRRIATFCAAGMAIWSVMGAGCSVVSGQSSAWRSTRATITELPETSDWTKPGNCHFDAEGAIVRGGYWSNQARKWKSFEWTDQKGVREVPDGDPEFEKHQREIKPRLSAWNAAHGGDWSSRGENVVGLDATPDGNVVVGFYDNETAHTMLPFVWRKGKGLSPLQDIVNDLPDGKSYRLDGKTYSVTRDGSAVLCYGEGPQHPRGGIILVRLDGASAASGLLLTGTVKAMSPGRWTIAVSAVTTPQGKTTSLSPARNKVILIPKEVSVPTGVKVGSRIAVRGQDSGKGKSMTAASVENVK